jgi:hypothetical protein
VKKFPEIHRGDVFAFFKKRFVVESIDAFQETTRARNAISSFPPFVPGHDSNT